MQCVPQVNRTSERLLPAFLQVRLLNEISLSRKVLKKHYCNLQVKKIPRPAISTNLATALHTTYVSSKKLE